MNKFYIAFALCFTFVLTTQAQRKIGDYTYIVVPEQYEFVKGKDAFRLNTLTRFQLRQYGYEAVFPQELPNDLGRCDVLYVDAQGGGMFVYTKMMVQLKDCNGFVVFQTKEARSKQKEYKAAYQEAMRMALTSFEFEEEMEVNAPKPEDSNSVVVTTPNKTRPADVLDNTVVSAGNSTATAATEMPKGAVYRYKEYRIVDSDKGLVVLHNRESIGTLVATSQKNTYLVNTTKISGIAYRTDDGFKIEAPVAGQSELMVMKFVKNEQ